MLRVNGKAEIVAQDTASNQEMIDRLRNKETLTAIREGLASAESGELKDADQVYAKMKARYGLQS